MDQDTPYLINRKTLEADQQLAGALRQAVTQIITERAVPVWPTYFAPSDDALVPYRYHRESVQALSSEINQLEQRLARLERPWWRRWLHR